MPYSAPADLLIGDLPLGGKYGDGQAFVNLAADEIDGMIGHLYVTPVEVTDQPSNRPTTLLLKKINNLLASGRLILDMAAAGEDRSLQAYGASMVAEAVDILNKIIAGTIKLTGAQEDTDNADRTNTAVSIHNEDPVSLVESFYGKYSKLQRQTPLGFYGG